MSFEGVRPMSSTGREAWKQFSPPQRREIMEALRRGERLSDRRKAAAAVYLAGTWQRWYRSMPILPVVSLAAVLLIRLAAGGAVASAVLWGVIAAATTSALALYVWRKEVPPLRQAERANREVLDAGS
jgi:hypothetical protein